MQSNLTIICLFLAILIPKSAVADDFVDQNFLIDFYQGSYRSSVATAVRSGGYELSDGEYISFADWYTPAIPDITILFLREVSNNFGIIWGFSTGEVGEKYNIEPALQLGFVFSYEIIDNLSISMNLRYPLFGRMSEKPCIGDYGDIGGIQQVNCRLAADIISPEDTLKYLFDYRGNTDASFSISISYRF